MFNANCDECVDFFEENYLEKTEKRNNIDSSQIITKAVIETAPFKVVDLQENFKYSTESSKLKKQEVVNDQTRAYSMIDYLSSPSSSLEKVSLADANLDSYLLNCLAFNDKVEDSDIDPLDSKFYSSDSSLSESSITTLSSDFTSVSPVLSLSDSSCCLSDESVADSIPDVESKVECVGNLEEKKVVMVLCKEIEQSESDGEELSQNKCSTASDEDKIKSEISTGNEIDCLDYGSEKNTNEDISEVEADISEVEADISEVEADISEVEAGISEVEANISSLEEDLEDISLASQSRSTPHSSKSQLCRVSSKLIVRKKEYNLTFSREELFKIERENLILLKKIMSHAKPRAVSINQSFNHKKTSAAINRARQQKKIEQDNYILYSKISAVGRMKKVF